MKSRSTLSASFGCFLLVAMVLAGCQQNTSDVVEDTSSVVEDPSETKHAELVSDQLAEKHESEPDAAKDHIDHESDAHEPASGHGPGFGRGQGPGMGLGRGAGAMSGRREDMMTIHTMFADQDKIERTVKILPNGAEAITESDDDAIASLLQEHVPSMEGRVLENNPLPPMTFHPIFVELIKHSDDYTLEYEDTDKGVKATYEAEDPFVVMLVQEHAKLVSRFIKNGMSEIHKPYTLPGLTDEPKKDAKTIALAAKEALFTRLSGRLTEVMKADGPGAAIQVCSREAATIAKTVGEEHGVKIGRTAIKLRNAQNEPPEWTLPIIKESPAEPKFVDLANGHTGALLPIKLQAKCVICHGPADSIGDEIKSQLAKLYPQDQATGFKEGDLRGWFWVEVPALTQ